MPLSVCSRLYINVTAHKKYSEKKNSKHMSTGNEIIVTSCSFVLTKKKISGTETTSKIGSIFPLPSLPAIPVLPQVSGSVTHNPRRPREGVSPPDGFCDCSAAVCDGELNLEHDWLPIQGGHYGLFHCQVRSRHWPMVPLPTVPNCCNVATLPMTGNLSQEADNINSWL